jgi:hypothetical protein
MAGGLGAAQGPPKFWDKWCKILHSRPLLALNFIIETSFFVLFFSGAPLSNTLWRRQAKKDVSKVHWTAFSKSKE